MQDLLAFSSLEDEMQPAGRRAEGSNHYGQRRQVQQGKCLGKQIKMLINIEATKEKVLLLASEALPTPHPSPPPQKKIVYMAY